MKRRWIETGVIINALTTLSGGKVLNQCIETNRSRIRLVSTQSYAQTALVLNELQF